MSIPSVSQETVLSFLARFRQGDVKANMKDLRDVVEKENPRIPELIDLWCTPIEDEDNRHAAVTCGVMVYHLLKSQAEAESLAQELEGRI